MTLASPKSRYLGVSALGHEDVSGLYVAVDDALGMGRFERIRNVDGEGQKNFRASGLPAMRWFSVIPFQILHDDEGLASIFRDFVDGADVGMVQSRRCPRFAAKALQSLRVFGHVLRQELQSNKAAEFEVLSFINHTHAAATELFDDAVVRDCLPIMFCLSTGANLTG